jgi:hypothetical protein
MKIYITEEERLLIASTPHRECWMCRLFSQKIKQNKSGYYLLESVCEDWGMIAHLEQIIGREVIY